MTLPVSSVNRRYRPHGERSTTDGEEHALVLEANWCRIAYDARPSANLDGVMRRAENRMETMASMLCTETPMRLSSRTSRGHCIYRNAPLVPHTSVFGTPPHSTAAQRKHPTPVSPTTQCRPDPYTDSPPRGSTSSLQPRQTPMAVVTCSELTPLETNALAPSLRHSRRPT